MTIDSNKLDKIKTKIVALLAKTEENGASEAEAIAALQKAQQLMIDYYIDANDLTDIEATDKIIKETVQLIKIGTTQGIFYKSLSDVFDCFHFYNKREISFVGFEQDAKLAAFFYQQIIRAAKAEKRKYLESVEYKELSKNYHGRTLTNSFLKGFFYQIAIKLQDIYQNRNSSIPTSMSLVLVDKKEKVKESFNIFAGNLRIVKSNISIKSTIAFEAGQAQGNEFNIQQGIDNYSEQSKFAIV